MPILKAIPYRSGLNLNFHRITGEIKYNPDHMRVLTYYDNTELKEKGRVEFNVVSWVTKESYEAGEESIGEPYLIVLDGDNCPLHPSDKRNIKKVLYEHITQNYERFKGGVEC